MLQIYMLFEVSNAEYHEVISFLIQFSLLYLCAFFESNFIININALHNILSAILYSRMQYNLMECYTK